MRTVFLLAIAAVSAHSFGESFFIENHSFENPPLTSGNFFYSPTPIPGWTATSPGGQDRGLWHTTATNKDGINIAFLYRNNALAQQLTATAQANTAYSLEYLQGRATGTAPGVAELWAGGTVVDGVVTGGTLLSSRTVRLNGSTMNAYSLTYVSSPDSSVLGQPLTVRLANTAPGGGYTCFDNIRLSTVAIPTATVSGNATLNDYFGGTFGNFLTIEVWQDGLLEEIVNVTQGANGSFSFAPIATGPATLKFKYRTGLKKAIDVTLGGLPITDLQAVMTNGDADGSGEVDAADIDLIITHFGETPDTPGFNSFADLDGSEEVDAADIDLAIANFGATDE